MREIKFRVYDTVNKCFISDMSNFWINPSFTAMMEWRPEFDGQMIFDLNDSLVFQQYTGLKDKNGVEIYEGDIVEWQYGLKYSDVFEYRKERFTITYCKEDAMFLGKKDPERHGGGERNWFYSKVVVGNIFEGVDK